MKDAQKIDLKTFAKILSGLLFFSAYKDSERMVKKVEVSEQLQSSNNRLGNVFVEMLHFYLNLTDRFAFQYLGDNRDDFFDAVLVQICEDHFEGYKSAGGRMDSRVFFRIFNETHKKRQEEYGKYRFVTEEVGELKGNLFWEFENRLAEIFGKRDDVFLVTFLHGILPGYVERWHKCFKEGITNLE